MHMVLKCVTIFVHLHMYQHQGIQVRADEDPSPIISLEVIELSENTFQANALIDILLLDVPTDQVRAVFAFTSQGLQIRNTNRYRSHLLPTTDPSVFKAQGTHTVLLRGTKYSISVVVKTPGNRWRSVNNYVSAPLSPGSFTVTVNKHEVVFNFTSPDNQTEEGIPSFYHYLRVDCANSHISALENEEHWMLNFSKPSGDASHVTIQRNIEGEVYKVFKNGGYIICQLVAVSKLGGMPYAESAPKTSSYSIEPAKPELTFQRKAVSNAEAVPGVQLEVNLRTDTFLKMKVLAQSYLNCSFTREDFIENAVHCPLNNSPTGASYEVTTTVWPRGPEHYTVQAVFNKLIVVPPLAPTNLSVNVESTGVAYFTWKVPERQSTSRFVLVIGEMSSTGTRTEEIYLNYSAGVIVFATTQRLHTSVDYFAWVQAIYKNMKSEKSNQVDITGKPQSHESTSTTTYPRTTEGPMSINGLRKGLVAAAGALAVIMVVAVTSIAKLNSRSTKNIKRREKFCYSNQTTLPSLETLSTEELKVLHANINTPEKVPGENKRSVQNLALTPITVKYTTDYDQEEYQLDPFSRRESIYT